MSAKSGYDRLLSDEELRPHLERNDTIVFDGLSHEWQQIERQVDSLGFGEHYVVAQRKGPHGGTVRVCPAED